MRRSLTRSDESARRAMEILQTSAEVFARQGYTETSLDDIADAMGSTKGKMYHYYRSKAELLTAIMKMSTEQLLEAVRPIARDSSRSPSDRIRAMVEAHATTLMRSYASQVVTMRARGEYTGRGAETPVWDGIRDMRRDFEKLYVDVVTEGQVSGEFSETDVKTAARSALGSVNWIAVWFRPGEADDTTIAEIATRVGLFVQGGLRGPL